MLKHLENVLKKIKTQKNTFKLHFRWYFKNTNGSNNIIYKWAQIYLLRNIFKCFYIQNHYLRSMKSPHFLFQVKFLIMSMCYQIYIYICYLMEKHKYLLTYEKNVSSELLWGGFFSFCKILHITWKVFNSTCFHIFGNLLGLNKILFLKIW
jgi:hypothetical protein